MTATAQWLGYPAVSTVMPLRRTFMPTLSGNGNPQHVALTFDDGPDRRSTPLFLDACDQLEVKATFFVLGHMLSRNPDIVRDMAARGHEIAVHGWDHRTVLGRKSAATYDGLRRTSDAIFVATGVAPTYFRPPYGVLTPGALRAARQADLTPVLWTCWGRDWRAKATPASVQQCVLRRLRGGGTILLHDSDCTSAPQAWRSSLAALPRIVEACRRRGLQVGPLREHGIESS